MRVAIVHDEVSAADAPDARDVLDQAQAVAAALDALGHTHRCFPCNLDLDTLRRDLTAWSADRVFNLVESVGGQGRLIHLPPFVFDAMGLVYTGADAEAMLSTSNKVMAKRAMAATGIPTPAWVGPFPSRVTDEAADGTAGDWIIKSLWEHASIGLDAGSLVRKASPAAVTGRLAQRAAALGGACFAERFIDGREFNLAILAGPDGPRVLPPAEILFEGFAADVPRIVDYAAKWDAGAYAYHHTPRRFAVANADTGLLDTLTALALRCWRLFGLAGYARVDFRVDAANRPWVLEVNANPCLSPDAGYAAALAQAGIAFTEAVERILEDVSPR